MQPVPWYQRKKIWTAIIAATGSALAALTGHPDIADKFNTIGMVLIGAFGLEDFGKAKTFVTSSADPQGADAAKPGS